MCGIKPDQYMVIYDNELGAVYAARKGIVKATTPDHARAIEGCLKQYFQNEMDEQDKQAFESYMTNSFGEAVDLPIEPCPSLLERDELRKLEILVATDCNLRCRYCYAHGGNYGRKAERLSPSAACMYLTKLLVGRYRRVRNVLFFGGEPTLCPNTIQIICEFFRENTEKGIFDQLPHFQIISNGTLIDEKMADLIHTYDIEATISIDGPEDIHNLNRVDAAGNGSFSKVVCGIELLNQVGSLPVLLEASAASILSASWMLFRMHPLLLLTAIIAAAIPLIIMKPLTKLETKCTNAYSKAAEGYTNVLKETIEGCEILRAAGAEEAFQQRYAAASRNRQRAWSKNDLVGNMVFQTLSNVASLASIACTVLGGWLTLRGVMTVGMLVAARIYFVNISNYFSNLTAYIVEIRASKKVREKLFSQMDLPCPADSGLPLSSQPEIVYDEMSFSFANRQLYSGLTERFIPGGCYVVVGESGSGKSTLLKLLLKYYGDYQGTISLAGQDIRRLSEKEVYELVGIVDQSPYLFNASLYENITMFGGQPGQDSEEYKALLRKLNLTTLAQRVGDVSLGDFGDHISGGERQRINIARALRRNPKILIFDEPTTGLDPENITMINEFIFNLRDVTRIVISHDWSEDYLGRFDRVIRIGSRKSAAQ